jgi:hypothetical protein
METLWFMGIWLKVGKKRILTRQGAKTSGRQDSGRTGLKYSLMFLIALLQFTPVMKRIQSDQILQNADGWEWTWPGIK